MDPAYTWHPGAVCVKPRWAARVDLLPDERLTSWLARAAIANGCDPGAFRTALWPKVRWDVADLNRGASHERLLGVQREGGVDAHSLRRSTLAPVASIITGSEPATRGTWPWITSVGPRNLSKSSATAFCALCLQDDARPYLRLQWRFAWHTVCPLHEHMLVDLCPRCGRPPHSERGSLESGGVGHCARCHGRLSDVAPTRPVDPACRNLQFQTDRAVAGGGFRYWGGDLSPSAWFGLLNLHLRGVRSAIRMPWNQWARALRDLGLALPRRGVPKQVEHASVAERAGLLKPVARLVSLSRADLLTLWRNADLSRQNVDTISLHADHPLQAIVAELPDRSKSGRRVAKKHRLPEPKSRTQVAWKMKQLLSGTPDLSGAEESDA